MARPARASLLARSAPRTSSYGRRRSVARAEALGAQVPYLEDWKFLPAGI